MHMCLQNILQKDREYLLVKIQENQVICLRRLLLPDFVRWAQRVIPLGVVPTPAVAYLTRYYKADAGVVISASPQSMRIQRYKVL